MNIAHITIECTCPRPEKEWIYTFVGTAKEIMEDIKSKLGK